MIINLECSLAVRQPMAYMVCYLMPDDKLKAVKYLCGSYMRLKLERFVTLTLRVSRSRNLVVDVYLQPRKVIFHNFRGGRKEQHVVMRNNKFYLTPQEIWN